MNAQHRITIAQPRGLRRLATPLRTGLHGIGSALPPGCGHIGEPPAEAAEQQAREHGGNGDTPARKPCRAHGGELTLPRQRAEAHERADHRHHRHQQGEAGRQLVERGEQQLGNAKAALAGFVGIGDEGDEAVDGQHRKADDGGHRQHVADDVEGEQAWHSWIMRRFAPWVI